MTELPLFFGKNLLSHFDELRANGEYIAAIDSYPFVASPRASSGGLSNHLKILFQ